jgi:uncharacterized protein (DUF1499 family)
MAQDREDRRVTPAATICLVLALLAALVAVASGLGYRLGWWPLGNAFGLIRYAAYGGIAAVVVSGLGAVLARPGSGRRGFYRAIGGLEIGVTVFGVIWSFVSAARDAPPIHDITTDTDDPPVFVAILPLRAGASNPPEYGGEAIAAQQRAGYPAIAPAAVALAPDRLFDLALATANDQGWKIVAAVPPEGRIEATATTRWFGFKDDIVIRIRPEGSGARLDIRSKSRIGVSDAGTNAARIEAFLDQLAQGVTDIAPT